jgi:hypothetical protein
MNVKKTAIRWTSGILFAAGSLLSGAAFADNCNGRWTNVNQSAETIDLGGGHKPVVWADRGSATSENSIQNNVGTCGGYMLTTPDGKTRLSYACLRKNKDGDSFSDAGGMEPGADYGTWKQAGGTGVYAGKNNSGTWRVLTSDGKTTTGTWTGNCN